MATLAPRRRRPGPPQDFRGSARVLEAHPRDRAIVGRGDELRHARARAELDIRLPLDPATNDALQRRARQAELIEAEVALRKRIETRQLEAHVAAHAHPNGAGRNEIELNAGKQTVERAMSAGKEPMRMPRLRRAGARRRCVGQGVAVEHNDLLEMGRDGFRRGETSHPRADDDGLLQNRIGHVLVSRWTRCRPGQSPADRTVSTVSERRYRRISSIGYRVTSVTSHRQSGGRTQRAG